jgi:hypothetical protein
LRACHNGKEWTLANQQIQSNATVEVAYLTIRLHASE